MKTAAFMLGLVLILPSVFFADDFDDWSFDTADSQQLRFSLDLKTIVQAFDLSDVPSAAGEADLSSLEGSGAVSLRFKVDGNVKQWLSYEAHMQIEQVLYSHPLIGHLGLVSETNTALFRGFDLESRWRQTDRSLLWAEVDYANARFTRESTDIIVGRQAVTFGRSFFWNPIDWLSSFSPTEIDREYKNGVDAARFTHGLGRFSGIELLYAYGEGGHHDTSALVGRYYSNFSGWDLEILGGSVLIDNRLGVAFSGELRGAGLRGEMSYHHPRNNEDDFLRTTIELDYKWPNSLQFISELHFNGFGSDATEDYASLFLSERVLTGQIPNVARFYSAVQLSYELTPLTTGSAAVLINLNDGSGLINPTLSFSLSDESRIDFGAIIPWGPGTSGTIIESEYGTYFTTIWVQWRHTF